MDLSARNLDDVVILKPSGRIDHTSASAFQDSLLAQVAEAGETKHQILLDMTGLAYMSSVGLRALMMAAKAAKKNDGVIVVAALQPEMKEIFEISRFHFIFKTFDTVEEALKGMSTSAHAAFAAEGA